jgi:hypothetical protein
MAFSFVVNKIIEKKKKQAAAGKTQPQVELDKCEEDEKSEQCPETIQIAFSP